MPPFDTNTDFDPVQEVRHLRQELALRLESLAHRFPQEPEPKPLPVPAVVVSITRETISKRILRVKRMLGSLQISRKIRTPVLFKGRTDKTSRHLRASKPQSASFVSRLKKHSEDMLNRLEQMNTGFTALGLVGIVFGVLCLVRGFDHDLSLGYPVCASGLTMILIGLGGYFFANPAKR